MDKSVFSEQEVTQIIRRAVELSESAPSGYKPGVTRDELEQIATEVGVSPDALRRAIEEAGRVETPQRGFKATETFERVVEGELDPDEYDLAVEGFRPVNSAQQAPPTVFGRTLRMMIFTGRSQANLEITSRNGRTKIKVTSLPFVPGMLTLYPAFLISLFTFIFQAEAGRALIGGAIAGLAMLAGWFAFSYWTKLAHRRAQEVADQLEDKVAEAIRLGDERRNRIAAMAPRNESVEDQPNPINVTGMG